VILNEYYSDDEIKGDEVGENVVRSGRTEIHNVFGRESEGKGPFRKPIRR
jgi:hypothetical protein